MKYLREHPTWIEMEKLLVEWRKDTTLRTLYEKHESLSFEWTDIFRKATDEERRIFHIGRSHRLEEQRMPDRKNSWGKRAHIERGELLDIIKRLAKQESPD